MKQTIKNFRKREELRLLKLNEINYDNLINNFTSQKPEKLFLNKTMIILINYFLSK